MTERFQSTSYSNRTINCDQVIWLQNALLRYAQHHHAALSIHPRVAHHYADAAQFACIIELMDILGLQVQDHLAEGNILARLKSLIPQDKKL